MVWRLAGVEGEVGHLHQRRHLDLVVGEEVVGLGLGHLVPVVGPVPPVLATPNRPLGITLASQESTEVRKARGRQERSRCTRDATDMSAYILCSSTVPSLLIR